MSVRATALRLRHILPIVVSVVLFLAGNGQGIAAGQTPEEPPSSEGYMEILGKKVDEPRWAVA